MPKHFAAAPHGRGVGFVIALSLLAAPAAAQVADRWAADETEARATLPPPRDREKVSGAEFACSARQWALTMTVREDIDLADGEAELRIDGGRAFPVAVSAGTGTLAIAVPRDALEPLMRGLRLDVDMTGALEEAVGDTTFSLRGSRVAITAMDERCSPRDMSAYRPVTFTPYSSYLNLARELRRDDIDAFVLATGSRPALDAAMAEFGQGRRVLFTRLCGSSWYFGASGCNIAGFAAASPAGTEAEPQEGDGPQWRAVYDTENVLLYTDPESAVEGWPDLVTLPVRSAGPGRVWRWTGGTYAFHGDLPEDDEGEPLPLRLTRD